MDYCLDWKPDASAWCARQVVYHLLNTPPGGLASVVKGVLSGGLTRNYEVTTGHFSYYHRLPYHEVLAAVSVGRYLAKDEGVTVELSRTFNNGVTFGVFATKTNVSSQEFGEGSFDKGFFMSMPLDAFFSRPTREHMGFVFRPLTRDGGQRLVNPRPLYWLTNDADTTAIGQGWGELLQ